MTTEDLERILGGIIADLADNLSPNLTRSNLEYVYSFLRENNQQPELDLWIVVIKNKF